MRYRRPSDEEERMTRRRQPPEPPPSPATGGGPMPVLAEYRDRVTGAPAVQLIDAKAVKTIRTDPHIGHRGTWLYVVTVADWGDRPMLMTGPLPEEEAMALVRRLHLAVAEAARG